MLKYIKSWLLLAVLLHTTLIFAQLSIPGASMVQKFQLLKEANKLPGLSREGITIPSPLLLEKMQAGVNTDALQVKALSLSTDKGRLQILAIKGINVLVDVDFKVVAVDWKQRSITLEFTESMKSGSDSAIGQVLGNVVLTAFAMAAGQNPMRPVQQALAEQPYVTFGETEKVGENRNFRTMTVWLNRIPDLQDTLNLGVGSFKLFDHVGIRSITTEQDQLRVQLGTF